ncbi:MAG: hypothetical protein ACI835_000741 [Planctomycetota bacterium]|jgi:hypothetical protein
MIQPLCHLSVALILAGVSPNQDVWIGLELPRGPVASQLEPRVRLLRDGRHIRAAEDAPPKDGVDASALLPESIVTSLLNETVRRTRSNAKILPGTSPLLVRGSEAEISELEQILTELAALERALAIELHVRLAPTAGGASWIDSRRSVHSGDRSAFGERQVSAFLGGYGVDVASDSAVADPLVGQVHSGHSLHVIAKRMQGGRATHIEGVLDLATTRTTGAIDTGNPDLGIVQLPVCDVVQISFSGIATPDRALVVTLTGALAGEDLQLTIAATAESIAQWKPAGWSVLDAAQITSTSMDPTHFGPGWMLEQQEQRRNDERGRARSSITPGSLIGIASEDFGREAELLWTPRLIFVPPGTPLAVEVLSTMIAALERPALTTHRLRIESDRGSIECCVAGAARMRAIVGTERLALVDYETELAPETWIAAPIVEWAFDGFALEGRVQRGTFETSCWISRSDYTTELAAHEVGLGRIQLPQRSVRTMHANLEPGVLVELLPTALVASKRSEDSMEQATLEEASSNAAGKPGTRDHEDSARTTFLRAMLLGS